MNTVEYKALLVELAKGTHPFHATTELGLVYSEVQELVKVSVDLNRAVRMAVLVGSYEYPPLDDVDIFASKPQSLVRLKWLVESIKRGNRFIDDCPND